MIRNLLASPAFFGLGVPVIFLLAGALAKRLVRRTGGWAQEDFFLGIEATLAAMASGLVNIFDIVREATEHTAQIDSLKLGATGGFLAVNFIVLLYLLSVHQDWLVPAANTRRRLFWLGFVSNGIGLALLGGFIVGIKGIQ
jgi:hypothetical protein